MRKEKSKQQLTTINDMNSVCYYKKELVKLILILKNCDVAVIMANFTCSSLQRKRES
jgi:hypothetical protein